MMALVDDILHIKEQATRCYKWDITGLLSFVLLETMFEDVTIVNAWEGLEN